MYKSVQEGEEEKQYREGQQPFVMQAIYKAKGSNTIWQGGCLKDV